MLPMKKNSQYLEVNFNNTESFTNLATPVLLSFVFILVMLYVNK